MRRLRHEDPVHWSPTGPTGPYWSVTKFDDIVAIETNHQVSRPTATSPSATQPADFAPRNFIAADPPVHDVQRKSVTPAVAPHRLADLEPLIRAAHRRGARRLPRGETFDWVDRVCIELTTQFLATLFDFPWEDRRLLPYWSDVTTASPSRRRQHDVDRPRSASGS